MPRYSLLLPVLLLTTWSSVSAASLEGEGNTYVLRSSAPIVQPVIAEPKPVQTEVNPTAPKKPTIQKQPVRTPSRVTLTPAQTDTVPQKPVTTTGTTLSTVPARLPAPMPLVPKVSTGALVFPLPSWASQLRAAAPVEFAEPQGMESQATSPSMLLAAIWMGLALLVVLVLATVLMRL